MVRGTHSSDQTNAGSASSTGHIQIAGLYRRSHSVAVSNTAATGRTATSSETRASTTIAGAKRVMGIAAATAKAEKIWSRTKHGIWPTKSVTGAPCSSETTYGVRIAAPHDEAQRYTTAMSRPDTIATNKSARKIASPTSATTDMRDRPRCRHIRPAQPASDRSPTKKPPASQA